MTEEMQKNEPALSIPEKFRDPATGELRIEALLNSYTELEKKLSGMMPRPDNDDARREVFKCLGCPDTPDQYEVDVSHGLFAADPDVNGRLHAKGLTAEQVQEVYALAAEKLVPAIMEMAQEFQADREIERLVAAFGGPEKWREMSRQLLAFGQRALPPDVLDNMASSYEGVMALHKMMKGQEPVIGNAPSSGGGGTQERDLHAMMRDPRYHRERDPAFVAKVTEGFRKMYGG
jgi:hypothetical protein